MARLVSLVLFVALLLLIWRALRHLGWSWTCRCHLLPLSTHLLSPAPSPSSKHTRAFAQAAPSACTSFPLTSQLPLMAFWTFFQSQFLKEGLQDHSNKNVSFCPNFLSPFHALFLFLLNNFCYLTYHINGIFCSLVLLHWNVSSMAEICVLFVHYCISSA